MPPKGKGGKFQGKAAAQVTPEGEEGKGPFPEFPHPSPEDCRFACKGLAELHQDVTNERLRNNGTLLEQGCQRVTQTSVLDSLVRTILSQNTTDSTSARAFASLKAAFPTWEEVMTAESRPVEDAVRVGGLAEIKVARIKAILQLLVEERGAPPSLEYLRGMGDEEAKAELTRFKGVGPKTAACVLMFCLDRNEFPVDTHVWHIAQRLGWVPARADREQTYEHLNLRVPDEVKFDLHVLLVEHGKRCVKCAKGGRLLKPEEGPCPLLRVGTPHPRQTTTLVQMQLDLGLTPDGLESPLASTEPLTPETVGAGRGGSKAKRGRDDDGEGVDEGVRVKAEVKEEVKVEVKEEGKKGGKKGVKKEVKEEVQEEVKEGGKQGVKKGVKREIKMEVKEEAGKPARGAAKRRRAL